MTVKVHRKVKIHKMTAKEFRKHKTEEIVNLLGGLTLDQLGSACRYIRILRSSISPVR